jgi:hypothetical protein
VPDKTATTWIVQLAGDDASLADLSSSFTEEWCCIGRDGDGYSLRSNSLSPDLDAEAVLEKAKEFVTALNGAASLGISSANPISVAGVNRQHDDGRRDVFGFLEPLVVTTRIIAPAVQVTRADGTIDGSYSVDPLRQLLAVSRSDDAVSQVLELYSSGPLNWVTLYKVWEIVEADVGATKAFYAKNWVSRNAIGSFTSTSQHPGAVGILESRHGLMRKGPPPKPMTLAKARSLLAAIVHH